MRRLACSSFGVRGRVAWVLACSVAACSDASPHHVAEPADAAKAVPAIVDAAVVDAALDAHVSTPPPRHGDAGNATMVDASNDKTVINAGAGVDSTLGAADTVWCRAKAVIDAHCVSCHNPLLVGGAPMSLQQYGDLLADAPGVSGTPVYRVLGQRIHDTKAPMPPRADLLPNELAALDAFVAADAPQGADPSCVGSTTVSSAPGVIPGGPVATWPPAECDAVYRFVAHGDDASAPYQVPAGQEVYPKIMFDAPWGDEPVQAIAFRAIADNVKVLHHWILYSKIGAFLTGWAPGDTGANEFSSDIGMDMPTGPGALMLDMHYFNTGGTSIQPDQSGVEVCIVKGAHMRPKTAAVTMGFANFGIQGVFAQPGAINHPVTGVCNVTTTSPVHLMSSAPHAHLYAQHTTFTVKKVDGTRIVLHDGPYSFSEQTGYPLSPEVILSTGDVVYTTCFYTNDTNHPLTFGESTTNEMCFNFAMYWPAGALTCQIGSVDGLP